MTAADDRQARIAEIFRMLDDVPAEDHGRRISLCGEALSLMNPEERAGPAAGWLWFVAGMAFVRRAGQDRVADLSAAIESFEAALATWTPEGQATNWVAAHANLGVALSDRHVLTGSADDEEAARRAFDVALRLTSPEDDPVGWAQLANNLGLLCLEHTSSDRAERIEEAIGYLDAAAQLQEQHGLRAEWARTQANLGLAYRERVNGERSANLERSLALFGTALESLGSDPADRVRVLLHRSETLRYRVEGTWAANVELAYADARLANELIAPASGTLTWAEAQVELGLVLRARASGSLGENLEEAIACFRRALACFDPVASPQRWALVSTHLGSALMVRLRGQRIADQEEALEHLTGAAAALRGRPGAVAQFAGVVATLGRVYLRRRRGTAADNAEEAWRYLSEARDLEEQLGMPARTRAAVLDYLGNASMAREDGDRGQRVEEAIACYELGLELAGPEDGQLQARLLNNLAAAYAQRPRGDRAANIARSLELYERIAAFRTLEMSPLEWAEARSNAASVLAGSVLPGWVLTAPVLSEVVVLDPDDAASRLDQAAVGFREALSVLTSAGPTTSMLTAGVNLGYLGTLARRWRDAADGYQAALDASNAWYRESLELEARYDELSEVAGLEAELAAALVNQARSTPDAALLRRAVATIENGRMRMIGELMERDEAALERLREERPSLYEAYRGAAERLRSRDAAQWAEFAI